MELTEIKEKIEKLSTDNIKYKVSIEKERNYTYDDTTLKVNIYANGFIILQEKMSVALGNDYDGYIKRLNHAENILCERVLQNIIAAGCQEIYKETLSLARKLN